MMGWKLIVWVAMVVATFYFLFAVRAILVPFIVAAVISALLEPIIYKLRLKGFSRPVAISMVFIGFFGSLLGIIIYTTPIAARQIAEFKTQINTYVEKLSEQSEQDNVFTRWNPAIKSQQTPIVGPIDKILDENKHSLEKLGIPTTRRALIQRYIEPYREEIVRGFHSFAGGFVNLITSAASQIFMLLLTPLLVYLMLSDMDRLRFKIASWIPKSIRTSTLSILKDIGEVFFKYMNGVAIVITTYTTVMASLFSILMTPYSILLGLITGSLYLIPFIGPWISAITVYFVIALSGQTENWLIHSDTPWSFSLIITGIFMFISLMFDQLVYPRVVGRSVGLHPLISMFVIFSGGALFGLLGMIIAFPLAGSVKVIVERLMRITTEDHPSDLKLPMVPLRHRSTNQF